ncbi:MAG TPA: carboxypeptidase regulatory-like domain-containing protein [Terriglobia bacterium]|nr:carboxypeptidase regulatory-like domain-containing protein [Terriglobia bacterium]
MMMIGFPRKFSRPFFALLAAVCLSAAAFAQSGNGTLSGQVTDPSGAAIPAATVTLTGPDHATKAVQTDEQGRYAFHNLAPGAYSVAISTQGFSTFTKAGVQVAQGHPQVINAQLALTMEKQQVTVEGEGEQLSVSPDENVGAVVLKGEALKSLSDDPDELQTELQELAGPAAGPNGGQIYIDGFSGGQLPPKDAILEVRVNQNPFSAQYERLGYGRIDITTKPGFQKYHGGIMTFGNTSALNSRNPFVAQQPDNHSEMFGGDFGGPLSKKASFFFSVFRRSTDNSSIVNAVVPAANFDPLGTGFSAAVASPSTRLNISPRVDLQLSSSNVLSIRYQRWSNDNTNRGIGQFDLPSVGYNSTGSENMAQISDTQVISARTVTQARFQYRHSEDNQNPLSTAANLNVIGAFTGGGSSAGAQLSTGNQYEFQSLTSMNLGAHALTYGGRVRYMDEAVNTTSGYNGTFTFTGINTYSVYQQGLAQGLTDAQIVAAGGGARQFAITAGNPAAKVNRIDFGLYAEDTWRMRPNVSLTMGLRFEGQNRISDHFDVAPRMGFAWGIGKSGGAPKTILRAGAGIFYDRFDVGNILQAEQLNGINQQQYIVNSPDFFPGDIPPLNTLTGSATFPTIYQIARNYETPYVIEGAVGLERQLTRNIKTSVTYVTTHGIHQLLARNINAPLPGTFDPADPSSGVRPFGDAGNIYEYEPAGLYNENQLIANFNIRMGRAVSLFGFYTLSYANANAGSGGSGGGPGGEGFGGGASATFPMNQYDLSQSYGTAAWASRNRFFVGGSAGLPYGLSFSPFMVMTSGRPYNITLGQDLNGDSFFNDRPALATGMCATCVPTTLGIFNIDPVSGDQLVPVNNFFGPSQFSMNARLSKTFGFGKEVGGGGGGGFRGGRGGGRGGLGGRGLSSGGGGPRFGGSSDHRYQFELGVMANNVFNKVNLGAPVGNITSPLFGHSNSLAGGFFNNQSANRTINLFLRFSF